jgi:endonuclease/exonuclease/phosphatase family metal-dependent hydrolase
VNTRMSLNSSVLPSMATELRLATFNMSGYDYQERWPQIAAWFEAERIDVVGIQEAVYLPDRELHNDGKNSAILLNRHSGYPYVASAIERKWHDRVHNEPRHEGLAVLSKFPVLEQRIRWLTHDSRDEHERFIQFVKLDLGSRATWLVNIHNSLSDPPPNFAIAHTEEVFRILNEFAQETGEYPIMAGDFNLEDPHAVAGQSLAGYAMSRQFAERQMPTPYITNPQARGEHGLVDRGIDHIGAPAGCELVEVKISDVFSDHSIVSAQLRLPALAIQKAA